VVPTNPRMGSCMHRPTLIRAAIGLLLAACVLPANEAGQPGRDTSATGSCATPTASAPEPAPAEGPAVSAEVAEKIQALARKDFPTVYTGIALGGPDVVLYRVPTPDNPLDAAVRRQFEGVPVAFTDAPRNETELSDLTERVVRDLTTYWHGSGVTIAEVGPDAASGMVVIRTVEPADAVRSKLHRRYGPVTAVYGCASLDIPF
jgi:hypothetical protein